MNDHFSLHQFDFLDLVKEQDSVLSYWAKNGSRLEEIAKQAVGLKDVTSVIDSAQAGVTQAFRQYSMVEQALGLQDATSLISSSITDASQAFKDYGGLAETLERAAKSAQPNLIEYFENQQTALSRSLLGMQLQDVAIADSVIERALGDFQASAFSKWMERAYVDGNLIANAFVARINDLPMEHIRAAIESLRVTLPEEILSKEIDTPEFYAVSGDEPTRVPRKQTIKASLDWVMVDPEKHIQTAVAIIALIFAILTFYQSQLSLGEQRIANDIATRQLEMANAEHALHLQDEARAQEDAKGRQKSDYQSERFLEQQRIANDIATRQLEMANEEHALHLQDEARAKEEARERQKADGKPSKNRESTPRGKRKGNKK